MPVLYLTIDYEIDVEPLNEPADVFDGDLGSDDWTICSFLLGKNYLKVFHNDFFRGGHYVKGGLQKNML